MRFIRIVSPYHILVALLLITFFLGGGARHDISSLTLLRPLACLAAAAGLLTLRADTLRNYRGLFILLGALAFIMCIQLVPLPPSWWSALPGRSVIHQLDAAIGMPDAWRPITFSPMKTANALASLVVPFATLALFVQLDVRERDRILLLLVGIAVASALLGATQQLAGISSGVYFYEITNRGSAVGLFANRNHHAVFQCCALLIALYLACSSRDTRSTGGIIALLAAAAVLFVAILANASRAGLICLSAALAMTAVGLFRGFSANRNRQTLSLRLVSFACFLAPTVTIFGLFAIGGRSPALLRLLGDGEFAEYRAQVLPDLIEMASTFQPWGAGFGAFEYAFRPREPVELLQPAYLNNAHNDWLQLAIEGGVPGLLVAMGAALLLTWQLVRLGRTPSGQERGTIPVSWLGAAILLLLAIASVVDYPLRVPSIMLLAIVALGLVFPRDTQQELNNTSGTALTH